LFKKNGFESYTPGDMDLVDQLNLFYYAEKIISPHGADLTNIIFSNMKPKILEIRNDYYSTVYWSLATLINCSGYWHFAGMPSKNDTNKQNDYDIFIDKNKFFNHQIFK